MKLEKDIEHKCVQYALRKGVPSDKLVTPGRKGPADRIFWIPSETPSRLNGSPWFVELKRPSGPVSKHQELFATKLKNLGYRTATIWGYEDFCEQLDELLRRGA